MYSYLALGDSYTIGEQVVYAENFPNQAVQLLRGRKVDVGDPVIVATTGWTTDELQAALREHPVQGTFSWVSLLIGVNNQYRGRSLENFRTEFEQLLLQAIHFAGGDAGHVFVLSIPDWGVTSFAESRDRVAIGREIDAFNQVCREVSKAHHCAFLEITESTRQHGHLAEYMAPDGLHPSGKEYGIWAHQLAQLVEMTLAHGIKK